MASIKWETADHMMNIVAFTVAQSMAKTGAKLDSEAIADFARGIFKDYCDTVGITDVEEPEDENEDENKYCDSAADCFFCNSDEEEWDEDEEDGYFNSDNDEENDDGHSYVLTAKGEFITRYMEAGYSFEEACAIADLLFGKGEGE